jgi:hypothetical protein
MVSSRSHSERLPNLEAHCIFCLHRENFEEEAIEERKPNEIRVSLLKSNQREPE